MLSLLQVDVFTLSSHFFFVHVLIYADLVIHSFSHSHSSPQRSTSMPFKKGTRSRTRVLRIFYPLHKEPKSSSNDFPNTSNDTIDQPSPGFLSSSSQATHSLTSTLSHSSVHAFGADAKRSVNPILTAISTAGAVSRARLDARRSSHGSESDYSPVRRGAEWNKETGAKFPSSLTQADFGGRETGTSEGKSAGHMMPARVMRVGSLSSSLNANRRGQPPLVNLEQAVCLNEMVARQRSESLNSTGNETLSNASSLDDRTTHGAARFHSRPEVGPWGLPRPLSYSGCGRDQITRVQTPLYVLLQTNMATPATATNGTPFGLSQKRFPISNSAARGFSRTISRVRTNSTLCPTLNPRNPFEIKLDKVTNVRSAGKGRWDLVRPRDERGLPLSPHRDLFAFRTLECLSLNTQVINLSQKRFPISNSAARGFSRTISRVRTNSTLCPTLNPRNPFEIKLDKVTNVRSAGKGRWDLVRPRDERGLPLSPHRDLFAFRTLECLSLNTQVINLSQVWAAYFVFLRSKLKQCAPGGPDQFFPSTTTTTTASTVSAATNTATNTVTTILNYFPGLFEDGRKAATISKGHISRIAVSWYVASCLKDIGIDCYPFYF
ncbi:hypothetical protein FGIG_05960 [Fasciola gigantica]|uniref:Uncharacterized protein n=1 Tax=Fasciola gigantica TaxID=46835 RepID=A0A504Z0A9_FASGI|nr:hypothetical protein FGIG_05960 [Fasciola gigantica]